MQKILFNDKFGLTKAVLEGRKTMTRRIVPDGTPLGNWEETDKMSRYKVGEVVAVAQAYCDIQEFNPESYEDVMLDDGAICEAGHPHSNLMRTEGWHNKMFVRADLMPHQIRITNVRVERLQDINDEDCLREGVNGESIFDDNDYCTVPGIQRWFYSPCDAFAALIDKVSGKGTWDRNPWVFVYEFELVK